MKKFNSQAETHSRPGGPPSASSPTHAEAHSRAPGTPLTSSSYFFYFLFLDYKHKRKPAAVLDGHALFY